MELSGIELRYLVGEIGSRVTSGYYVSHVNAITKSSLLLRMHHPTQEDIMLVISTRGVWITKSKFKPLEENRIESAAQSEIGRAKLESIEQAGSERIASLKFRQLDGSLRILVGEFFGEGNLIICDEGMQIIAILNPIEVRHRTLGVGLRYAFPPARGVDVFQVTLEQMLALRGKDQKNLDVLRWIGRSVSMPRKFVEEVARRAQVQPDKKADQLTDEEVGRIYEAVRGLVNQVSGAGEGHEPVVIMQAGRAQEALPILTHEAAETGRLEGWEVKKAGSYMEAVDEALSSEMLEIGRSSRTVELDREIGLLQHDIEEQDKAKQAVTQKAASIRKLAGELMALSYSSPNLSSTAAGNSGDATSISGTLAANSASIVLDKGVKYVEVAGERVELEPNLAKTSSMLFARAKEMERGSASIDEAKAKLLVQIEKLRSRTAAIHKKVTVQKQSQKEWYERYRWFVTTDGLMAIGGRDASSNSALIRKNLTENDLVFHAEVHGSPFFILKNAAAAAQEGQEGSGSSGNKGSRIEESLRQVAQATVAFSRAWKDGLSSADAYWVLPEQVRKGAPTGQFLPKGSFVIEGKRNYLKGVEIRLAIGVVQLNDGSDNSSSGKKRISLVCGPEDAVKQRSLVYSVLLQGGMDPMNAAKKIKAELVAAVAAVPAPDAAQAAAARSDEKERGESEGGGEVEAEVEGENDLAELVKQISLDDFVRALPTGQSRVSFTKRGSSASRQAGTKSPPSKSN